MIRNPHDMVALTSPCRFTAALVKDINAVGKVKILDRGQCRW
jgi:hypothetical protein